jgi:uncharacterized protein
VPPHAAAACAIDERIDGCMVAGRDATPHAPRDVVVFEGVRMRPAAAALLALLAVGCAAPWAAVRYAPDLHFDTATVRIATATDTVVITAEIAATLQQKQQGLMERESMPDDHGMLFLFDEAQDADFAFYMYRTHIPLDVAFIAGDGAIVRILSMDPCAAASPAQCPRYEAGVPFRMALEVNRGFFARRGIGVGARVLVDATATSP